MQFSNNFFLKKIHFSQWLPVILLAKICVVISATYSCRFHERNQFMYGKRGWLCSKATRNWLMISYISSNRLWHYLCTTYFPRAFWLSLQYAKKFSFCAPMILIAQKRRNTKTAKRSAACSESSCDRVRIRIHSMCFRGHCRYKCGMDRKWHQYKLSNQDLNNFQVPTKETYWNCAWFYTPTNSFFF